MVSHSVSRVNKTSSGAPIQDFQLGVGDGDEQGDSEVNTHYTHIQFVHNAENEMSACKVKGYIYFF